MISTCEVLYTMLGRQDQLSLNAGLQFGVYTVSLCCHFCVFHLLTSVSFLQHLLPLLVIT